MNSCEEVDWRRAVWAAASRQPVDALREATRACEEPARGPPARSAGELGLRPDQVTPQEKEWVLALVKSSFAGRTVSDTYAVTHAVAEINRLCDVHVGIGELRRDFPRVRINRMGAYLGVYFEARR